MPKKTTTDKREVAHQKFKRIRFIHEIYSRPLFKVVVVVLAILGTLSTVRELALPEQLQTKLNFYKLWSLSWPWYVWALVVMVSLLVVVFEGALAAVARREKLLEGRDGTADEETSLSLRERVHILAAQISRFHDDRAGATPGPLSRSTLMIPTTPQEWNEATLKSMLYSNETHDIYLQRFAPQVTLILKELAKHGVVDAELNAAYLLNSNLLIGIREVAEHLNRLADRLPLSGVTAPDVTLGGTFPGILMLHVSGYAGEIRIGPIVMESRIIGTHKDGDRVMNNRFPRYALEFPPVSEVIDDEKAVFPSLLVGDDDSRSHWQERGVTEMAEFLRAALLPSKAERDDPTFSFRTMAPREFHFDITFWNRERTVQWAQRETLVCEPESQTGIVRHSGMPVLLFTSGVGAGARS